ncbi:hypothetical protein L195_g027915 [Trifolium pratense]|uniref:Uncharacterized protein n=1 Tax=Trifolium pratense TaxID=57577 RepID=A0A2K3L0I9_TRIPR|nr:hypothetical protein L195_g027915 [Trifolium pratense]
MQFVDSMFDDSPEGVLHEWWSVFYEVFSSRLKSPQESEPQSANTVVPRMTDTTSMNISSLRIPQMPMNEQRPQQFQASSSPNMRAQTASRLMPPRLHNSNNRVGNLAEHVDPSLVALINENDPNFFSRMSSKNFY